MPWCAGKGGDWWMRRYVVKLNGHVIISSVKKNGGFKNITTFVVVVVVAHC